MFLATIKQNTLFLGSDYNRSRFKDFLSKNNGKQVKIELVSDRKARTLAQNSALWLFLTQLAEALNDSGLEMRKVLKPTYSIPWTKGLVHDLLWIPVQKAMFKTDSTTKLPKLEQIDKIHELLTRELGEKHGLEVPPFPQNTMDGKIIGKNFTL